MQVVGIDPGPFTSHAIVFDGGRVVEKIECDPGKVFDLCATRGRVAIEDFEPFGSPVSADSIRTIKTIGVAEQTGARAIGRKAIKLHLCGTLMQIKDRQVREALIERFGPGKEAAIGTKANPGPLYGVSGHYWSALAVAVVAWDQFEMG